MDDDSGPVLSPTLGQLPGAAMEVVELLRRSEGFSRSERESIIEEGEGSPKWEEEVASDGEGATRGSSAVSKSANRVIVCAVSKRERKREPVNLNETKKCINDR